MDRKRRVHSDESVFTVSLMIGGMLLWLPLELHDDGFMVPTIIFNTQLMTYKAFTLSLLASNYFSLCSMLVRDKNQRVASIFSSLGFGALLLTLLVLQWALFFAAFKWVSSQ